MASLSQQPVKVRQPVSFVRLQFLQNLRRDFQVTPPILFFTGTVEMRGHSKESTYRDPLLPIWNFFFFSEIQKYPNYYLQ